MRFFILLVLIANFLKAAEDNSFAAYILKFYDTEYTSKNRPVLIFSSSLLQNNFNSGEPLILPNTPQIGIKYGFTRNTDKLYYEDFYYHSFEYAFLENRNSRLFGYDDYINRLNMWSFGFGWADGYSFSFSDKFRIEFVHDISINWAKSYFPNFNEFELLENFQDNWRFGSNFHTGINLPFNDNVTIELRHSDNLNFHYFEFFPWTLSFAVDNLMQRWPSFFEEELIESLGSAFPIVIWIYKSFVSYTFFNLREENEYWPAVGQESLNSSGFTLNFKVSF